MKRSKVSRWLKEKREEFQTHFDGSISEANGKNVARRTVFTAQNVFFAVTKMQRLE